MSSYLAFVRNVPSGGLRIERRQYPRELSTGDLLCRTQIAGICGTDLQILRGLRTDRAAVLGHEGLAVVEATHTVENMVGQTIIVNPTDPITGVAEVGHSDEGLLQELFVAPARWRNQIDREGNRRACRLTPQLAVLAEPLASVLTAMSVIQRVHRPRRVLIVGRGTAGHLFRISLSRLCNSMRDIVMIGTSEGGGIPRASFDTTVLCANRDRTETAIRIGVRALRSEGVLYLFGGISNEYADPLFPGMSLSAIRFRNSGGIGRDPVGIPFILSDERVLTVSGSRGTSNRDMTNAMDELVANPSAYLGLLTIVSEPHVALFASLSALARIQNCRCLAENRLVPFELVRAGYRSTGAFEKVDPFSDFRGVDRRHVHMAQSRPKISEWRGFRRRIVA